jgi:enoyl-CoA hydratase/carnithine racemase
VLRRLSGQPDVISVAVVAGAVVDAGIALALACDLRIITDDGSLCFAGAGSVPAAGVAGTLVDLVGYPRALQLCLTGRPMRAAEAYRLGLAVLVAERGTLDEEVERLVSSLLAVPREVCAETKALLVGARGRTDDERRTAEVDALARIMAATSPEGNTG